MQRFFIHCLNVGLLVLVFIGIPAATRAQWDGWQISSGPQSQRIMLCGLALAAAANLLGALGLTKSRKERRLGWEWTAVFAGLWLITYAFYRGYFNFEWLKHTLLWLQKHL